MKNILKINYECKGKFVIIILINNLYLGKQKRGLLAPYSLEQKILYLGIIIIKFTL